MQWGQKNKCNIVILNIVLLYHICYSADLLNTTEIMLVTLIRCFQNSCKTVVVWCFFLTFIISGFLPIRTILCCRNPNILYCLQFAKKNYHKYHTLLVFKVTFWFCGQKASLNKEKITVSMILNFFCFNSSYY